jgi:hypothetical protein
MSIRESIWSLRAPLLLAAAGSLAGACSNVVDLEVEAQQICVAQPNQSFPAPPAGLPASKPVPLNFSAPLKQLPSTGDLEMEVKMREITLSAGSGGDLSFIETVSVEMGPPSKKPTLTTFTVAEYLRNAASGGQKKPSITLVAKDSRDVSEYLKDEPGQMKFSLTGSLPSTAFNLNIEACVGANARFQY